MSRTHQAFTAVAAALCVSGCANAAAAQQSLTGASGIITYRARGKHYVAAAAWNTSFVAWKATGRPTLFIFGL